MLSPTPWPSPTWLPFVSASLRVSKIASFGHSGRQAPQEIHSSVISNAMTLASFYTTIKNTRLTSSPRHDHYAWRDMSAILVRRSFPSQQNGTCSEGLDSLYYWDFGLRAS